MKIVCLIFSLIIICSCSKKRVLFEKEKEISEYYYIDQNQNISPLECVIGYNYALKERNAQMILKFIDFRKMFCFDFDLENCDSIENLITEDYYTNLLRAGWSIGDKKIKNAREFSGDEIKGRELKDPIILNQYIEKDYAIVRRYSRNRVYYLKKDSCWRIFREFHSTNIADTVPSILKES